MSREGAQQMMLGHHGKFPTLPAPKRPAGPTRQTSRTDTLGSGFDDFATAAGPAFIRR